MLMTAMAWGAGSGNAGSEIQAHPDGLFVTTRQI
jgi:hypothetical protein